MTQKPKLPTGTQADMLLAVAQVRGALRRLALLAKSLPEHQDYHRVRTDIGVLLNRLTALEQAIVTW